MSSIFTGHGGRLAQARATFGGAAETWIDLSTGINPNPWPDADRVAVDWRALPDPTALAALEQTAAAHFGVDPALCCAVPGSEMGLRLLGGLLNMPGRHRPPTYRTHVEAFPGSMPLGSIDDLPADPVALVLANPNNPDGRLQSVDTLCDWHDRIAARHGWLIVDEAFADCMDQSGMAPQVAEGRRLIISRSFGKFFGLAGLRLGFLLGPPDIIAQMRGCVGEWPVSAAAIAIGARAYGDRHWIEGSRITLHQCAAELDALLARHELRASGACPLFRLVETADAAALFERLARAAILTRPFADNPRWLRLGLPADADQMARLDAALVDG